ncbi:MAG: hypothetical protein IJ733_14240, partial [Lachnospiraceae bacterium]|nr:hypothetical protein [Lachnospiraceae bacterium]
MTAPFCIEVSKAGGTYFTDSKVARTSFAGKESSISNNSVDYYEKSTSNDKLSAPTVDTKLVYGSGKYTLEFYNASIEKSYEIHIIEKTSTSTKETFLTLKPTGKKSADDSTALGRKKVTYKTNIVDGDDIAKKLCMDGELEIEIRELGVKADATLPSVS